MANTRPWAELRQAAQALAQLSYAGSVGSARLAAARQSHQLRRPNGELRSTQNSTPSRPSIASTARAWRRHAAPRAGRSRWRSPAPAGRGRPRPETSASTTEQPEPVEDHRAGLELRQRVRACGRRRAGGRCPRSSRAGGRARGPRARRGTTRPPPRRRACWCPRRAAPSIGDHRERGGRAAEEQHRHAQEVAEPHAACQRREHLGEARDPVDDEVGALDDRGRTLVRAHAHAERALELALPSTSAVSASKASRSVASSPPNSAVRAPERCDQVAHRLALVDRDRRPDLEHLAAPVDREAGGLGLRGDALQTRCARLSSSGAPRQWKATIGPLSSIRTRSAAQVGRVALGGELFTFPPRLSNAGVTLGVVGRRPARAARRRASRRRRSRRRPRGGARRPPSGPRCTPRRP